MEQRGRRRHIPAFGEWNQLQCEELPITQYFESVMLAGHYYHAAAGGVVLFRTSASPPPQKSAEKLRSTTMENQAGRSRQQGAPVADGGPRVPRMPRVVRAVDDDLYKVPSNDVRRKKGKGGKHVRKLWIGCAGLNCVA